ncbi:carbohydrate ABC transporter permease [Acaryochloris marina]|uniref:carbohydrate ABC transporter permease n=1 Tax=Acaryochloris marina TaxID=155978 RepID=UPI001BAFA170|nr:carbohydrate ABC transporter permease [Acaryochloris marina]QUY43617.1 carbohydrate ABC transporter permease [Acaryochloris marina S15]
MVLKQDRYWKWLSRGVTYVLLGVIALAMLLPLLWLVSTAFKGQEDNIFPVAASRDVSLSPLENIVFFLKQLFPVHPTWHNFVSVWQQQPFGQYFLNSLFVSSLTVTLNVLFSSLAAYPLARLDFKGKDLIFAVVVSTIMIPFQIVMIPLYVLAVELGLKNTYLGVIFPAIASAFGIFLLRQAFQGVPKELEEAARIDGCTELGIWWHIMLPSVRPALVTLAIFVFIGSWGEFLWPLIILDQPEYYTLPLAVSNLFSAFGLNWRLIAAGSVISVAPVLLFFLIMQRYIVPSEAGSGLKG